MTKARQEPKRPKTCRICTKCGRERGLRYFDLTGKARVKNKTTGRYVTKRYRRHECHECRIAYQRQNTADLLADPYTEKRFRERNARKERERRARDPQAHRDAVKRYQEKVKLDPVKKARRLEGRRMAYRLKREREGLPVTPVNKKAKVAVVRDPNAAPVRGPRAPTIPNAPLVAFIDARIEQRRALNRFVGEDQELQGVVADVCAELGIVDRTLHRWRTESPNVSLTVAEEVILRAGVAADDVYSHDDDPEALRLLGIESEAPVEA